MLKKMMLLFLISLAIIMTFHSSEAGVLAGPISNPANGHQYYLLTQNTWTASEAEAVSLGGHLATIDDADENNWVLSTFSMDGGTQKTLWIGLTDAVNKGNFTWISADVSNYRNWSHGEPNNIGTESCVHIYDSVRGSFAGQWNNYRCDGTAEYGVPLHGVVEIVPTGSGVQSWDMIAGFSISDNPAGQWSYGRKWSVESSSFDPFTQVYNDWEWWFGNWGHGAPGLGKSGDWIDMWAKNNSNGYPVVRWTCPKTGFYRLTGSFIGDDSRGVDNMVYVVINGTTKFTAHIQNYHEKSDYFIDKVFLNEGEFVDFITVWNGGVYSEYGWLGVGGTIEEELSIPADGLVAYYPFNGNTNDESGNGNNGTVNGATLTTDRFGNPNSAYNFTGVNGNTITTPLVPSNTFSLSLWYNANATQLQNAGIFSTYRTTLYNGTYYPHGGSWEAIYTDGNKIHDLPSADVNKWVHLVFVSANSSVLVYKNGNLVLSFSGTTTHADTLIFGSSRFNGMYFTGVIDDVLIYNRALSAAEVTSLNTTSSGAHVDLGSGTWSKGSTVQIPVTLTNVSGTNIGAISVDIGYDTAVLENPSATIGAAGTAAGKSVSTSSPSAGVLRVLVAGLNTTVIGNGVAANVTFGIKAAVTPPKTTTLQNTPTASDPLGNSVTVTGSQGTVNIIVSTPGDCDGNGTVSVAEVMSAIAMHLGQKAVEGCVDQNNSGSVTVDEVMKVINKHLGL